MSGNQINRIERRLLHFLCGGRGGTQLREEMISRLRTYAFRSVEHQVLFDCLQAMPLDRPELVRELLPARVVLAGFPDFDLEPFFEAGGLNDEEARTLCRELTQSSNWQGDGE